MKRFALASLATIGLLMYDRDDTRSQQLGSLFLSGSIFGLPPTMTKEAS